MAAFVCPRQIPCDAAPWLYRQAGVGSFFLANTGNMPYIQFGVIPTLRGHRSKGRIMGSRASKTRTTTTRSTQTHEVHEPDAQAVVHSGNEGVPSVVNAGTYSVTGKISRRGKFASGSSIPRSTEVNTSEKEARIVIRVDGSSKELIEKAAALSGQSLSSFIISRMLTDAQHVIDTHNRTVVSLADWERFQEILANPRPPNAALKRAARRYKDAVTQSDGL